MAPRPSPAAWVLLLPVRFYRKAISPFLPPQCRFYPSCSAYAAESLTRHGAARGSYLALRRLLRCGPWTDPGRDPVPETFSFRHHPQRPDTSTEE
ncbi:membrane protein insertion efficiency factor YidD [Amycolatopsis palatopharyngis]|uniref:membrane protein insertion efficiency factor YidD n=1 Tax=Amycolatopsis palatopharyngis TaxID=187982 RepID=UPI00319E16A9